MRYKIINSKVVESLLIDAPYDLPSHAQMDIDSGIDHNCERCTLGECPTQDALQRYNAKQHLVGKVVGE